MLDPEALAREWVPGKAKPVVRLLARGLAASTWRVRRGRRSFAMRIPLAVQPAGAGGEVADALAWERSVFTAAAAAGLGPPVAASDAASGVLVTEWVSGRAWSRAEARDPRNTARLAALLRAIHALQPAASSRALGPVDWISHYRALASPHGDAPDGVLAGQAERHLAAMASLPPAASVLCHSDLHRLNLLETARGLVVLDWEYAHFSEPYWDLAGWLSVNDLDEGYGHRLLGSYLGREPGAQDLRRLALLTWLYDYVCLLWSEAYRGRFAPQLAAAVEKRARSLAARLRCS